MPYYLNSKIIDHTNVCEYLELLAKYGVIPMYDNIYNNGELKISISYSGGWGSGAVVIEYDSTTGLWTSRLYDRCIKDKYMYLFESCKAIVVNDIHDRYLDYKITSDCIDDILEPSLGSFDYRHYKEHSIDARNMIADDV